jgi:hypothetical protein
VVFDLGAIKVGRERGRLAQAQVAQLVFLEVGIDPHLLGGHHAHERRARSHALAQLHAAARHVAGHGRRQHGTALGEVGLVQLGGGGEHGGVAFERHALRQRLVARELFARRGDGGFGCGKCGARGVVLGLRLVQLFLRDGAIACELLAPLQDVARARDVGARARGVGFAQAHLLLQRGVVNVDGAHLAHGLRERRLGLRERHARIGRVQPHERRAGLHIVGVVGKDGRHGAAGLRRDLDHVALYVGVVGVLVMAGNEPLVGAPGGARDEHHDGKCEQGLAAGGVGGARGVRGLRFGHGLSRKVEAARGVVGGGLSRVAGRGCGAHGGGARAQRVARASVSGSVAW